MAFTRFTHKLYQYYQLSTSFCFAALFARWLILIILASSRFLPGGIHEFLMGLLLYASVGELFWLLKFRGFKRAVLSSTFVKDLNFLYVILVLHFYDDYEHALVLKNHSYSVFIASLGLSQAYAHWTQLFKRQGMKKNTIIWKIVTYVILPTLYCSEFYLLLLNVQNLNFHSTPTLDVINKLVLVTYFPIALTIFKKHFY
ncbi:hypothetical protein KAFR_0J00250 [Kazachstania africana CBS 2517]|uniref:Very-long-chain (3R)-3-hydroxyacyl-CoA dehydratase n=1 Tax=Kazachstania africana (strain ATCC 22294 / BCRC 22015 / CBS 2517 / CECT 1963 / NBRC 1671 / NRRL Y-8276) TaxID=1071382 RepID=H2B0E3_KAZAF|nr:hypothetical protein KAFR_0J00250 [Kazachstania africana CBS 2517]CCF60093.1 hypothetical protein KAFR_0J00250 [Kazachstania africana CBS 2517]